MKKLSKSEIREFLDSMTDYSGCFMRISAGSERYVTDEELVTDAKLLASYFNGFIGEMIFRPYIVDRIVDEPEELESVSSTIMRLSEVLDRFVNRYSEFMVTACVIDDAVRIAEEQIEFACPCIDRQRSDLIACYEQAYKCNEYLETVRDRGAISQYVLNRIDKLSAGLSCGNSLGDDERRVIMIGFISTVGAVVYMLCRRHYIDGELFCGFCVYCSEFVRG